MQEKVNNKRLTYEEFLALCDEDTLAEWVDGKVEYYSPATMKHQDIVLWLAKVISEYVSFKNIGKVLITPFQMYLKDIKRGREPDILFISNKNLARLNTAYFDGPADLVVEIISEESRMRDKKIKFEEYEKSGVKEYWLIDPYDKVANFYLLKGDKYQKIEPKQNIYYSEVIKDFWLNTNWLFEDPLPKVIDVLRDLNIIQ
jgi:Uma2 family endonuclease